MTQDTPARERIASVADRAFYENGSERVPLREVLQGSGQSNMSAINYHFGGRDGLMLAVFRRRREALNSDRNAYLDAVEAEGRGCEVRALIEASVYPHVKRIRESPPTSDYARFAARMTPRVGYGSRTADQLLSADQRIIRGLRSALGDLPDDVLDDRIDTAFNMMVGVLAAYELRQEEDLAHGPGTLERVVDTLIDMVTAGLTA